MKRITFLSIVAIIFSALSSLASVTAQELSPTPTSQIIQSLSDQVGFSDQTLFELQINGINTVDSTLAFSAYNQAYKLFSIVQRIPPNPLPVAGAVLLYKMDSATPKLLWRWNTGSVEVSFLPKYPEAGTWPPPSDWLQNDSMLFGIATIRDSTSWAYSLFHVFELHSDQTVSSILKDTIPVGYKVAAVKIRKQGRLLIYLDDLRGEGTMGISNCCGPRMHRFFEYDGQHMTDVSAKYIDEYNATLGSRLYSLTTWKVENITGQEANLLAKNLLELLMIYEIAGYRQEGWTLVQSLVAQAKTYGRLAENTYVDTTFMPTMSQLFRDNKPFIEPDYVGQHARVIPNYYIGD